MRTLVSVVASLVLVSPAVAQERGCPDSKDEWMGLRVCEEPAGRAGYDRDDFGSGYSSKEDEIIQGLPQMDGQVYTPYTCTLYDIKDNGTADTDIEHIVALAEAYDSGVAESDYRTFAADIDNLTIAAPNVNRFDKGDRDAADWQPDRNRGWYAATVISVKQKYSLSVNPVERDALEMMLRDDPGREVDCSMSVPALPFLDRLIDRALRALR